MHSGPRQGVLKMRTGGDGRIILHILALGNTRVGIPRLYELINAGHLSSTTTPEAGLSAVHSLFTVWWASGETLFGTSIPTSRVMMIR